MWGASKRAILGALFCLALTSQPDRANALAFWVLTTTPVTYSNLAAVVGTVVMNATTGAMSGSGYLAASSTARGTVVINRATPVSVSVSSILAPSTITCGSVTVAVTGFTYDDTGCSIVTTGLCTIYVALSLNIPAPLQAGSCTAVPLDVTVV